jgi:hypothetical protein
MRQWLFYKRTGTVSVEFRRVGGGCGEPHVGITAPLNEECIFPSPPTEKDIETFVRKCGWVGEPPRSCDHPVAQTILLGRW